MENWIIAFLFTAALFLAIILQLAAKPKSAAKITGGCIIIAGISGLAIYSYGFSHMYETLPLAIVRALLAVCGMYVGKVDFSAVSGTVLFQNDWAEFYFYFAHLCALYATASAAITTVGGEALQKLRLFLARSGHLHLIYGINTTSLDFGKALLANKKGSVVFVGKDPDGNMVNTIIKAGGAVRSDSNALEANEKFLRAIGIRPGNRKVTLYTMHRDNTENLPYAKAFLEAAKARGIKPEQTTLIIPAAEDANTIKDLQVLGERYGYGFVTCYREAELAARLLTRLYPPCNAITFDENCIATDHFHALLIGFGKIGQAVLRQLVMQGQFVGSKFHIDIFAPDCFSATGYFDSKSSELMEHYSIKLHDNDAHSKEFFSHVRNDISHLKYIVVATGSDKNNQEIAENLSAFLHRLGSPLPIYLCAYSGVNCCTPDGTFTKPYKLYQPDVISTHMLDRMAMELNASYQKNPEKTPVEHWMRCKYFDRMSSRAAADFFPAFLRAAGKTEEDALNGNWVFTKKQLDTLGHMEHLRWNAFHICEGYTLMTDEEFERRAAIYRSQTGDDKIAVRKNTKQRTHACLVDWKALKAVSKKVNAVTGESRDFQQDDIDNVLNVPTLIRCSKEESK